MKGYKAFKKGLICKDKQYQENTVFEEDTARICESGMHFCENPLDTLEYYPLIDGNGDLTEFAEVEALDEPKTDDNNKKFCTTKLKIGARLDLAGFVKASVDFIMERCKKGDNVQFSSGDYAKLTVNGANSVVAAIGIYNKIRGALGTWITLAEWKYNNDEGRYICVCVKSAKIDGEKLKPDTWYKLVDGDFKEV